ncbi:hypothetical protein [Methylobacterium oxalidis]|uniref:hypothetical protein n=1 Tax=Methylobacterium oxalidis TaxID=944322 RepID=UPI0033158A7B
MAAEVLALIAIDCAGCSAALAQRACSPSLEPEIQHGVAWMSRCLLVAGAGFLVWSKAV